MKKFLKKSLITLLSLIISVSLYLIIKPVIYSIDLHKVKLILIESLFLVPICVALFSLCMIFITKKLNKV